MDFDNEIFSVLARLEYAIQVKLRPTFLVIIPPQEFNEIHVIISTVAYKNMTIQERVNNTFSLLNKYIPDIIEKYLIVIQTYSGNEMEDVLDNIFREELP